MATWRCSYDNGKGVKDIHVHELVGFLSQIFLQRSANMTSVSTLIGVSLYSLILAIFLSLMWLIIRATLAKPPVRITLVDLINVDWACLFSATGFISSIAAIAIEAKLLTAFSGLALAISYSFHFVSFVFLEYASVGIVTRYLLIRKGHMDIFGDLLDTDIRNIIRVLTATISTINTVDSA